jgi:hypothetical protein
MRRVITLCFGVALSVLFLASCGRVTVVVQNAGSDAMRDVTINFKGGEAHLGTIMPGASSETPVHPSQESDLSLHYRDSLGHIHAKAINVYIERKARGTIQLVRLTDNEIRVKSRTHPL